MTDPRKGNDIVLRNQKILLVRRPNGLPQPEDFRLEQENIVVSDAKLNDSDDRNSLIVLETLYVSIDPAMRGWMSTQRSYLPPVPLGSVMRASTVSRVIAAAPRALERAFPVGSLVRSEIVGVQSYFVMEGYSEARARKRLTRLEMASIPRSTGLSPASHLGVLGTTGMTAYFGLLRVGEPKPSDVVLVSGAAGATGSIVAQIAKHVVGCKTVIGTAGTDEKCAWLEANGVVDVAINYKTAGSSLSRAIREASSPGKHNAGRAKRMQGGVDVVFDNVGSEFLEAALGNLAEKGGARVVLCGAISRYNQTGASAGASNGPRNYMNLLVRRASMKGFVVFDYKKEYPTAIRDLVKWISDGKIRCYGEDMRHVGIGQFYPALLSLFRGTNTGKVVLKVNEENAVASRSRL